MRPIGQAYDDAKRLANKLKDHWLARGYKIEAEVFYDYGGSQTWNIRTNLRNGLPRGYKA